MKLHWTKKIKVWTFGCALVGSIGTVILNETTNLFFACLYFVCILYVLYLGINKIYEESPLSQKSFKKYLITHPYPNELEENKEE